MTDDSAARLRAALGFAQLEPRASEVRLLHRWLDSWRGIGDVVNGMHRAGFDRQLTEYGDGDWRATFYVTGQAHSIVGRSAWEATPWRATQRARRGKRFWVGSLRGLHGFWGVTADVRARGDLERIDSPMC